MRRVVARGRRARGRANRVLFDAAGKSFISFDDYAVAILDEIEHPTHPRARMTVTY